MPHFMVVQRYPLNATYIFLMHSLFQIFEFQNYAVSHIFYSKKGSINTTLQNYLKINFSKSYLRFLEST